MPPWCGWWDRRTAFDILRLDNGWRQIKGANQMVVMYVCRHCGEILMLLRCRVTASLPAASSSAAFKGSASLHPSVMAVPMTETFPYLMGGTALTSGGSDGVTVNVIFATVPLSNQCIAVTSAVPSLSLLTEVLWYSGAGG